LVAIKPQENRQILRKDKDIERLEERKVAGEADERRFRKKDQ